MFELGVGGKILGVGLSNAIQALTDRQWRSGMLSSTIIMKDQHVRKQPGVRQCRAAAVAAGDDLTRSLCLMTL